MLSFIIHESKLNIFGCFVCIHCDTPGLQACSSEIREHEILILKHSSKSPWNNDETQKLWPSLILHIYFNGICGFCHFRVCGSCFSSRRSEWTANKFPVKGGKQSLAISSYKDNVQTPAEIMEGRWAT